MKRIAIGSVISCAMISLAAAAPADTGADSTGVASCVITPKRVVQLGSPVAGLLSDVLVDRGAAVTAGQIVAKLESSVEEAQLEIDQFRSKNTTPIEASRVDLEFNQKALAMREQLRDNMFAKAEDVDKYRAMVNQDQIAIRKAEADLHIAELEAIRSERQLNLKQIRSSINGVVTERKLSPGEHVYEQTPILTIAEINPLYVELVVNAEQYPFFRVGMTAEIHPGAPVGGVYSASVDVVDPVIDAGSNTFRVRLILPNPRNAIPAGVRCTVRLPNKSAKN
jgi:RND family efflux transporter MFP subunit